MSDKPDKPERPKKRDKWLSVPIDDELRAQANAYAKANGISLAALIRSLLAYWTEPNDPRPLPPNVDFQVRRAKGGGLKPKTPTDDSSDSTD